MKMRVILIFAAALSLVDLRAASAQESQPAVPDQLKVTIDTQQTAVSAYDYRDGLDDRDKRPPRLQPMWSDRVEPNDVGLHEFIALCRLVGAEPDLAIDSGFGLAGASDAIVYQN
jgi:hypothetical protein